MRVSASHLGLVFSNLLGNALKYNTSAQPMAIVESRETEEDYIISITDNGIGIDKKYTGQVFEILKCLHSQSEYEGTGVGLAICKRVVESYGGNITVESELNKGTSFYLQFPKTEWR